MEAGQRVRAQAEAQRLEREHVVGRDVAEAAVATEAFQQPHLLRALEPVSAVRLVHAIALPAGFALLLLAPYLRKGRHRAWQAAVGLMVVLGALDMLKGPDLVSAAVTWSAAALLGLDLVGIMPDLAGISRVVIGRKS